MNWKERLLNEMCQKCNDEGMAAVKAEKNPRKKQVAYNKARRKAEHRRHGKKGETPRQTQVRRHGRRGLPAETPDIAKADTELDKRKRQGDRP